MEEITAELLLLPASEGLAFEADTVDARPDQVGRAERLLPVDLNGFQKILVLPPYDGDESPGKFSKVTMFLRGEISAAQEKVAFDILSTERQVVVEISDV